MSDSQLHDTIDSLPKDLKKQVVDFVEFLEAKSYARSKKKKRTFGYAKGFFKIEDNFDDPLDEFKEYM